MPTAKYVDAWTLGFIWPIINFDGRTKFTIQCRWCAWNNWHYVESSYPRAEGRLMAHVRKHHPKVAESFTRQLSLEFE